MTTFESKSTIQAPIAKVYQFLEDCNNHEQLQPENIQNWTSTHEEASFSIQNMATIAIRMDKKVPDREILFLPKGEVPFDLSIHWKLTPLSENETAVTLELKAALNMMFKMMASAPLQKLIDVQVSKLKDHFA